MKKVLAPSKMARGAADKKTTTIGARKKKMGSFGGGSKKNGQGSKNHTGKVKGQVVGKSQDCWQFDIGGFLNLQKNGSLTLNFYFR